MLTINNEDILNVDPNDFTQVMTKYKMDNITLQINLSPGDINYALQTVPILVAAHSNISNRMLVVDCCRPQKTTMFDPDKRIPLEVFNTRVIRLLEIVEQLKIECDFSEIVFLYENNSDLYKKMSQKYLAGLYDCTHSAGGTANMSYWVALDSPNTKYILHYDADILIYQKKDIDWVQCALNIMESKEEVVAAVPRLTPPVGNNKNQFNFPAHHLKEESESYWIDDWFSTRHFLIDKKRLESYLPMVRGSIKIELLARKWLRRAFPRDPEILLHKTVGGNGGRRLMLKNEDVFLLHPNHKGDLFYELLPSLLASINEGKTPIAQQGVEDLILEAWQDFF